MIVCKVEFVMEQCDRELELSDSLSVYLLLGISINLSSGLEGDTWSQIHGQMNRYGINIRLFYFLIYTYVVRCLAAVLHTTLCMYVMYVLWHVDPLLGNGPYTATE
jgi:hypothetical protein